jgi:DNA-binding beta-propeller fold protein YncE
MRNPTRLLALCLLVLTAGCGGAEQARQADPAPPRSEADTDAGQKVYYAYVAAESEDEVALIRFDGERAEVAKTIPVGVWPTEIEGPHGITVSPDGEYWFVSLAHGNPYGKIYKYKTGTDELVGSVEVGLFPATMQISPITGLLYVVNFNLHGDMVPSTLSVVEPEEMTEIAQIPHGTMPHGSRISPDGLHHYAVSMMTDELLEVDALSLEVTRRLKFGEGHMEHGSSSGGMQMDAPRPKPTWVHPHPTRPVAYVAYNGANEIAEVDLDKWEVTRTFPTDKGPYNLEVSPDGRYLVVSYKGAGRTGIWDLEQGEELANLENTRKVTHGVAITPDSRYAFVSVEGIGGEPGTVDVFDLQKLERVASADTGKQAGGIYFWKAVTE